ncbi:MAG: glycosyl transferase [Zunongwangia sp.]|jgi:glycosyltransferase involved in cell wall biosynthesis|uniref:glycosyltransferase family 4 protein n=1 Tax=Zunongwangia profunda TaxID=398743 RepID=UPI000C9324B2|nr:glycosyltransferase family 4 protein [Zunongwangia profunda]MAG89033.1 glycosyl transferase [Flavobacteriaceae bacterium]MAO35676.1 glycosyl transferase [Zunongwangia sp.]MCC4230173.1 glycosyltransferase family 4 protein [Zunongwangia profunda]|tara:strand:- start:17042 stop:18184 length:1143 start_codon:yes stop_codon:yes gene_type:complete
MHIGFLTSEYPENNQPTGGIGSSIYHLSQALLNEGLKISIFIYDQDENSVTENDNLKIYKIKRGHYKFGGFYFYRKHLQNYLNTVIQKEKIDAIEIPDWTGISAFMKLKCPIILKLHGSDAYFCHLEGRKQKAKNRFFEKNAYKNADAIIAVSDFVGNKTNEIFQFNKEYKVIHNLIPLDRFVPNHQNIKPNTMLYFGSIIRKKGVLELAEIFNLVIEKKPETQLILAGRDVIDIFEKESTLNLFRKKLSKNALSHLDYRGVLDYNEIQELIKQVNLVVLPSFAEAFPMTWLETMALEKPLISSNIGWSNEIMMDGKTGFTIHPKIHSEFAEKILNIFSNTELYQKIGKNARNHLENNFSPRNIIKTTLDLYFKISKENE